MLPAHQRREGRRETRVVGQSVSRDGDRAADEDGHGEGELGDASW